MTPHQDPAIPALPAACSEPAMRSDQMERSAVISECGLYRHILRRSWDISKPAVTFIMLNPSTADAENDDPTIRKCIGFAERLGYGGFNVVNLFDYRATKPADLKRAGYPCSRFAGWWIAQSIYETGGAVICAWGANARGLSRPGEIFQHLRAREIKPVALKLTHDGIPCHPLMLPYTCTPIEIRARHD